MRGNTTVTGYRWRRYGKYIRVCFYVILFFVLVELICFNTSANALRRMRFLRTVFMKNEDITSGNFSMHSIVKYTLHSSNITQKSFRSVVSPSEMLQSSKSPLLSKGQKFTATQSVIDKPDTSSATILQFRSSMTRRFTVDWSRPTNVTKSTLSALQTLNGQTSTDPQGSSNSTHSKLKFFARMQSTKGTAKFSNSSSSKLSKLMSLQNETTMQSARSTKRVQFQDLSTKQSTEVMPVTSLNSNSSRSETFTKMQSIPGTSSYSKPNTSVSLRLQTLPTMFSLRNIQGGSNSFISHLQNLRAMHHHPVKNVVKPLNPFIPGQPRIENSETIASVQDTRALNETLSIMQCLARLQNLSKMLKLQDLSSLFRLHNLTKLQSCSGLPTMIRSPNLSALPSTTIQAVTSGPPSFEFFYQICDWVENKNLTSLKQKSWYKYCLRLCPPKPPGLVGFIEARYNSRLFRETEKDFENLKPGGRYSPTDCIARHHVAIIIPYRDRKHHLQILMNNLHKFLQKQQLNYGIYVIGQFGNSRFNRAMLMNIGFKEALKVANYSCFVFHDVDHIPVHDNNIYGCYGNPRHLAVAVDKFDFRLIYTAYFGGVSSLSRREMETVNGFSNMYFGWGGEDDDMWMRIKARGMKVVRYGADIGTYRTVRHDRDKGNEANGIGMEQITEAISKMDVDGLNSLKYKEINRAYHKLFTWILVTINEQEVLHT